MDYSLSQKIQSYQSYNNKFISLVVGTLIGPTTQWVAIDNLKKYNLPRYLAKIEYVNELKKRADEIVFTLLQINLDNWFSVEFTLLKQLKLQLSELDNIEYYRTQYLIDNYKDWIDKEKEREEKEKKNNDGASLTKSDLMKDANKMMSGSGMGKNLPNMGQFGSGKLPSLGSLSKGFK